MGGSRSNAPLIAVLAVADMTAAFESSMVLASLKAATHEVHSVALASWLVTAYFLVAAIASPIGGRLGDAIGRKRILVALLVVAACGSLISALASDFPWVLVGRSLQGASGAIFPLCLGILRENLPRERLPSAIGFLNAISAIGVAAGLLIGGMIVDHGSWRGIFFVGGAAACASILLAVLFLPRGAGRPSGQVSPDLIGGGLFSAGAALLLYAISGKAGGETVSPVAVGGMGFAFLAACVAYELRLENSLLNFRVLANPRAALTNLATAFIAIGSIQLMQIILLLLQQDPASGVGFGLSATLASSLKLPSSVSAIVASLIAGPAINRIGGRAVLAMGAAIATAAWAVLGISHASLIMIIAMAMAVTFGFSMVLIAGSAIIVEAAPADETSEAAGFNLVIRSVFMGAGAVVVGNVLASDSILLGASQLPSELAYTTLFWIIAAFSAGAIGCAALMQPESRRSRQVEGAPA